MERYSSIENHYQSVASPQIKLWSPCNPNKNSNRLKTPNQKKHLKTKKRIVQLPLPDFKTYIP